MRFVLLSCGVAVAALAGCAQLDSAKPSGQTITYHGQKYRSSGEVLNAVSTENATKVAAVTPVGESNRIGGRIKVVIPDRDRLRPVLTATVKGAPTQQMIDMAATAAQSSLASRVEALKRSGLFETVVDEVSNDTRNPSIDGYDYLLYYRVQNTSANYRGRWVAGWTMRKAGRDGEEGPTVDPGVAPEQQIAAWVAGVKGAAERLNNAGPAVATSRSGTLTGIVISKDGHILTAAHGVNACREVRLAKGEGNGDIVSVVSRDRANDLALLKAPHGFATAAALRESQLRLTDNVIAIGYPYSGIVSSGQTATTGTVSALSGLRDDSRIVQFSAPIQPGNSGGPLLDSRGSVAGVVNSQLNALAIAAVSGSVPQNVNFAIKSSVARVFLDSAGVPYRVDSGAREMRPADIVETAKAFTVQVQCFR